MPAAVFLVAFACFARLLGAEFLNYDDDTVLRTPHWQGLSAANVAWMFGSVRGVYSPLGWLSHAIDWHLWGLQPAGHHLTSVLLHATNSVLLYYLILSLTGVGRPAAALGALFWAVHPLRVEPVAWITARWDLVGGMFALLTFLLYVRMVRADTHRGRWYAAALGCFLLACLSKAWAMTFPVVLIALDVWPLRRVSKQTLIEKLPFVALAIATAVVALVAQRSSVGMADVAHHGFVARLAQAAYGLCIYVVRTIAPIGLSPLYAFEVGLSATAPRYVVSALAVVAALVALVAVRRRMPALAVAAFCYVVIVSPVLGLAQTGVQIAADRYTYLSCLPWAVLAAAWLDRASRPALGAAAAGVLALGIAAVVYSGVWLNSIAVWNRVLERGPGDYFAHFNRGHARFTAGDLEGARADYDECGRLHRGYLDTARQLASQRGERGAHRFEKGDIAGALADFDESVRLDPFIATTWSNRGLVRRSLRDARGALSDFGVAILLDPRSAWGWANRGLTRLELGDPRGAVEDFTKALEVAPADWPPRGDVMKDLERAKKFVKP